MKSVRQAIGVGDALGLALTRFDSVITAACIYALADQPPHGTAVLRCVIVQADMPESCRRAASMQLDGLKFVQNAIEDAAHRLADDAILEVVLAMLPGHYV